ncbi:SDR family NAD(P)-dependent oxidoreductase [Archangium violaceum]|uniref:SDR family NAD(P)-dependent oxidoreductase n=1 Tax=Archangium violaceum TaxID=83451 RepID=UPI002B29A3B3|nr:SDR family NAD(P)-dependent oxidoreductase [Archangium gephyra]
MTPRAMTAGEAERLLLGDSRVQDVCVVGEGRAAVAWVVPQRGAKADALSAFLRERLGEEAPPVTFLDAIPLLASGAPDRDALSRLEPVTPAVLRQVESRFREAGLEAVALAGPRRAPEVFEPIDELLPASLRPRTGAAAESKVSDASAAAEQGSGRPSLVEGGPRRHPPGNPAVLTDVLRRAAKQYAERTITFIDPEGRRETLRYAELWDEALRMLGGLTALGVKRGDRVMLLLERPGDYIRAFWACTFGGVVPAPMAVPPSFDRSHAGVARVLSVVERLGGPFVLAGTEGASALRAMGVRAIAVRDVDRSTPGEVVPLSPSDPAILSFTSGSTGKPKGIVLSQDNMVAMYGSMTAGGWYEEGDIGLGWMPLDHVAGINYVHMTALCTGTPQILVARDYILTDILRWMDLHSEFRATVSWAPNFAFGLLADRLARGERRAWDLKCVRVLGCAGEPLVAETMQRFVSPLVQDGLREDAICPIWGMAETASMFTAVRGVHTHAGEPHVDLGPALSGGALRIVDDQDAVVPEGTVGHLQVRGAAVLAGYLSDPELNAKSFTQDGWFRTGDLAVVHDGHMAIAGRQKELLIVNGNNVYPHEIEAVVELVPGVLPSYAVASPTRVGGLQTDEVIVFFVPAPEAPPLGELLRSIREAVARTLGIQVSYLVPVKTHQVPKTELGKRGRTEMRRRFESGELAAERREAERVLGGPATLPRCLAVPRLVPRPQVPAGVSALSETVLLFSPSGFATALKETSSRPVEWVALAPDANPLHTLEALEAQSLRFEDVVYVMGREEASRAGSAELARSISPLLRLVQGLTARAASTPVRLWVVAPRAEGSSFEAAPLLVPGLLWSAKADAPNLSVRLLWVPSETPAAAAFVAGELQGLRSAREVSFHDGQRWERGFTPWVPSRLDGAQRLRREGLYLVTGALGGIGQAWARHLKHSLGARLVLVGRRARDAAAEALERELGATYAQADVTDSARLRAVLDEAESRHGRPFDGVFHFAGNFEPVPLEAEAPETFIQHAAAHVLGALALAEAFQPRPEALLFFASSVMGTVGWYATSYCAATGFIDRFVEHLAARGRRAVAVSLGPVKATGMARTLRASPVGSRTLEPQQVLAALVLALESGRTHVLVGVDGSAPAWRTAGLGAGEPLEQAHVFFTQAASPGVLPVKGEPGVTALHPRPTLPRRPDGQVDAEALAAESFGEGVPSGPLEEMLVEAFREVLGVEAVGVHSDFFSLGGSSLQATRVMARIQERLGLRLRESVLFDQPSVSRLAAHLQELVRKNPADVSQLSDEQVELMLRVLGTG